MPVATRATPEASADLILGMATGYRASDIAPFVRSLHPSGYRGRCRIVVNPQDTDAQRLLAAHGVETVIVGAPYRWLWETARRARLGRGVTRALEFVALRALQPFGRSSSRPSAMRLYRRLAPVHPTALRYFIYLEQLLEAQQAGVRRVLLADTRDLIFQRDPFDGAPNRGLVGFLEERSESIGSSDVNATWMRACYGEAELAALADRPIFCSGTILGERDAMVSYLRVLTSEIAAVAGRRFVSPSGFDQACHNHLLHHEAVPFTALENGASPVMHLSLRPAERLRFSATGELLNDDGGVVAMVHQWDRHPDRFRAIIERLLV